jgi:predicted RNase H-like nuclease
VLQPLGQVEVSKKFKLAGIDGCRGGWAALFCGAGFSNIELHVVKNWTDLDLRNTIAAVDMPIGLSEDGDRLCDAAARKYLGSKSSSIFKMPARGALKFKSYADANAWSKKKGFGGISKQAWNLMPKVRELDICVRRDAKNYIYETHPELAFARLANGQALPGKKTGAGFKARLKLLEQAGVKKVERFMEQFPARILGPDDILDAAVLLTTADRIAQGVATFFPAKPKADRVGRKMTIWV